VTAAARAAAKRAERTAPDPGPGPAAADEEAPPRPVSPLSGRTVLIEVPDGWDDPPEPSPDSFKETSPDETSPEETSPQETSPQEDDPDSGTTAWRSRKRLLTAVLCVLLAAGLVAVAVLGWQYRQERRAEEARGQALAAARKAAPVVLSYDYRHLDRDFSAARGLLTGNFRDEYRKTTKAVVGPTARKYEGVVKATVVKPAGGGAPAASVVSASPDKAVVLLFVNQVTKSTQVTGSRVDLNRVRMTLTRTSEGWKVSAVDAL
jgi:Mce-associated membrane protein